ncbi:ComEA family DNA-binding protein [Streptomyces sp. CC228A]|uniref:ComEA family DNA-binding protein n=1 Tax=Streptomyces sp. CC228A TaxID=2898186 RepID=UPI0027E47148|nr:ComEA family DNA-binding protein [Streptomyces sp. CC228A]
MRERLPLWLWGRCGMERRTLAALAVVLLLGVVLAGRYFLAGRPEVVRAPDVVGHARPAGAEPPAVAAAAPGASADGPTAPVEARQAGTARPDRQASGSPPPVVVVDVSGKVLRPGVLRLPLGSRVVDALRAAGGVRPGADVTALNRARVLVDGEHVVVGVPGVVPAPAAAALSVPAAGPAATGPVSLSTATAEQLDTLPGVGPVLARQIIDHRTRNGGFRSVEELRDVRGIGARRFADLRPLVRP